MSLWVEQNFVQYLKMTHPSLIGRMLDVEDMKNRNPD